MAEADGTAAAAAEPAAEETSTEITYPDVDQTNKEYLGKLVEVHGFANVLNSIADNTNDAAKAALDAGDRKTVLNTMRIGQFIAGAAEKVSKVGKKKEKGADEDADDAETDVTE